MKNLLLIFSVLLSTSLSGGLLQVFVTSDVTTPVATLQEGDSLQLKSTLPLSTNTTNLWYTDRYIKVFYPGIGTAILGTNNGSLYASPESIIYGPCEVSIYNEHINNFKFVCNFEIIRASEIQYQNGNIVSVPSDVQGAGTHNIVVETSSDLINWTPVHSSAISGGSEAFVRTRISTSE